MKGLKFTQIVKEIRFEGVWGELEPKVGFHSQSVTKYFRLTIVSTGNSALGKKFNFATGIYHVYK